MTNGGSEVFIVIGRRQFRSGLVVLVLLVMSGVLYAMASSRRAHQPPESLEGNGGQSAVAPSLVQPPGVQVSIPVGAGFDEYRLERDRTRSVQVEMLQAALGETDLAEEQRSQITAELMAVIKRSEREMQTEALLRARGFADAVVVTTDNGATAVVPAVLTREDAAVVGDLVARNIGVAIDRVTIIDGATGP